MPAESLQGITQFKKEATERAQEHQKQVAARKEQHPVTWEETQESYKQLESKESSRINPPSWEPSWSEVFTAFGNYLYGCLESPVNNVRDTLHMLCNLGETWEDLKYAATHWDETWDGVMKMLKEECRTSESMARFAGRTTTDLLTSGLFLKFLKVARLGRLGKVLNKVLNKVDEAGAPTKLERVLENTEKLVDDLPSARYVDDVVENSNLGRSLNAIHDDYWRFAKGIDVDEARALAQAEGFNFEIGRASRFENARNAVIIGNKKLQNGKVNVIELVEEMQHGLDRTTGEASKFARRYRNSGLSAERINELFHVEHFQRIIANWEAGKFQFLSTDDIANINKIIEDLL